jgi:hypothetical protein
MSEAPAHDPRGQWRALAAEMARALREHEDQDDAADADRAWEEQGMSVPLEDLEAEFCGK